MFRLPQERAGRLRVIERAGPAHFAKPDVPPSCSPWLQRDFFSSANTSRPNGLLVTLQSVALVSHGQKPSWCFVRKKMQPVPASFARNPADCPEPSLTNRKRAAPTLLLEKRQFRYRRRRSNISPPNKPKAIDAGSGTMILGCESLPPTDPGVTKKPAVVADT